MLRQVVTVLILVVMMLAILIWISSESVCREDRGLIMKERDALTEKYNLLKKDHDLIMKEVEELRKTTLVQKEETDECNMSFTQLSRDKDWILTLKTTLETEKKEDEKLIKELIRKNEQLNTIRPKCWLV